MSTTLNDEFQCMDTKNICTFIDNAKVHFSNHMLKKASIAAQIALDFAYEEGIDDKVIVKIHKLLATIFRQNGIYQSETSFLEKSIFHIQKALELSSEDQSLQRWNLLLQKVNSLNALNRYNEALLILNKLQDFFPLENDIIGEWKITNSFAQIALNKKKFNKAIDLANHALDLARHCHQYNHPLTYVHTIEILSQAYVQQQNYTSALFFAQKLLHFSSEHKILDKELSALKLKGIICSVKTNYKMGMQYSLQALSISEKIGFRKETATLLINIATIYAHLFNYEDALNRYNIVLEQYPDTLSQSALAILHNNIGNIYYNSDQIEKALHSFKTSLEFLKNDPQLQIHSLAQISRAYLKINKLELSKKYAIKAEQLLQGLPLTNGQQINDLNLAQLALRGNDYGRALDLATKALGIAIQLKDDHSQTRAHHLLSKIYQLQKNYEKALIHLQNYAQLQKETAKTQKNRKFLDLEIQHAIKEQKKEIEDLTRENKYQAKLLEQSDKIAQQNQELIQVNQDLRQFAYVASHDLKEPLRMISSYAKLIEQHFKDQIPENKKEYFEVIKNGTQQMSNLLEDLLKYATIGKNEIDIKTIDANRSIELIKFYLQDPIKQSQAQITTDKLPVLYTNKPMLNQLFQNLISNSLKFQKPNVPPQIHISYKATSSHHNFSIKDNGIGIDPKNFERIFVIFQRLHTRDQFNGTGIGLAICQKIVHKLSGKLWVESQPNQGTTMHFSLPINYKNY